MILKKAIVSISASRQLDTYYICTSVGLLLQQQENVNLCYFERRFGGYSQKQAHISFARSAGIHRVTNAFKGHSLSK